MELVALVFVLALPIVFLVWSLKFKGVRALSAIAPLFIILSVLLIIQNEASPNNPPSIEFTSNLVTNSTTHLETINGTDYVYTINEYTPVTTTYPIPYQYMQLVNVGYGLFMIIVVFVIMMRAVTDIEAKKQQQKQNVRSLT